MLMQKDWVYVHSERVETVFLIPITCKDGPIEHIEYLHFGKIILKFSPWTKINTYIHSISNNLFVKFNVFWC